jgi:hypothetical protein
MAYHLHLGLTELDVSSMQQRPPRSRRTSHARRPPVPSCRTLGRPRPCDAAQFGRCRTRHSCDRNAHVSVSLCRMQAANLVSLASAPSLTRKPNPHLPLVHRTLPAAARQRSCFDAGLAAGKPTSAPHVLSCQKFACVRLNEAEQSLGREILQVLERQRSLMAPVHVK